MTACKSVISSGNINPLYRPFRKDVRSSLIPGARMGEKIAGYARRAYDLEGMHVGIISAGRVGLAVLKRLRPLDVRLHYTNSRRLPLGVEDDLRLTYHPDAEAMRSMCDVIAIHTPLHKGTVRWFDIDMIGRLKRGAYLVNTARSEICDPDAVRRALKIGRLSGYAADTLLLPDTPAHAAVSTLSAQGRYAAGIREVLECWFDGVRIRNDYLIVDRGRLTGHGARSYGMKR